MQAPLAAITVIEVANYVAAPSVGALMADLGADVIKVEPPGGEVMRGVIQTDGPDGPAINYLFELENRGKRSVTVALNRPGGPELVHELIAKGDVFLTNLLAGRLEKYGLTEPEIHATNPEAIFCSVSGYGSHGPEGNRLAFDFAAFWARSGIMSVSGHPGAPPVLSRIAQGDHTTGMNALAAIFAALRVRDQTGAGQTVEVTLQQTGAYTIATDIARALFDGRQPSRMDREAPSNPLFNTYETSDGGWILLVHMTPDPYWPKLCAAIERDDWAGDEAYATMAKRVAHGIELGAGVQAVFRSHPLDYWRQRLDEFGLIWAPMTELPDVVQDESLRAIGAFESVDHPLANFETVGVPFTVRDADISVRGPSPAAGEHTQEVLEGLGLPPDRIAELATNGVLG